MSTSLRYELSNLMLTALFNKIDNQIVKEKKSIFDDSVNMTFSVVSGKVTVWHPLGEIIEQTHGRQTKIVDMPKKLYPRMEAVLRKGARRNKNYREVDGLFRRALNLGNTITDFIALLPEDATKHYTNTLLGRYSKNKLTLSPEEIADFIAKEQIGYDAIKYCLMNELILIG